MVAKRIWEGEISSEGAGQEMASQGQDSTSQGSAGGEQQLQSETSTGGGRFRRIERVCSQLRQRKCRWKAVLQAFHWVVWSWD